MYKFMSKPSFLGQNLQIFQKLGFNAIGMNFSGSMDSTLCSKLQKFPDLFSCESYEFLKANYALNFQLFPLASKNYEFLNTPRQKTDIFCC